MKMSPGTAFGTSLCIALYFALAVAAAVGGKPGWAAAFGGAWMGMLCAYAYRLARLVSDKASEDGW